MKKYIKLILVGGLTISLITACASNEPKNENNQDSIVINETNLIDNNNEENSNNNEVNNNNNDIIDNGTNMVDNNKENDTTNELDNINVIDIIKKAEDNFNNAKSVDIKVTLDLNDFRLFHEGTVVNSNPIEFDLILNTYMLDENLVTVRTIVKDGFIYGQDAESGEWQKSDFDTVKNMEGLESIIGRISLLDHINSDKFKPILSEEGDNYIINVKYEKEDTIYSNKLVVNKLSYEIINSKMILSSLNSNGNEDEMSFDSYYSNYNQTLEITLPEEAKNAVYVSN